MKTYWNIDKNLTVLNEWQPNCWIQVTCPTDEDQRLLEEEFKIPDYFLSDISDTDERARYEYDDGWMLIILRIPYVKEIRSRTHTPPCLWVSSISAMLPSPYAIMKPI